MDILVSYQRNHFFAARREAKRILRSFGDPSATVERTSVIGIAVAHTSLDNREVIRKCKELYKASTEVPTFQFAIKWVPVDFWCDTTLESMKDLIEDKVRTGIGKNETWGMKVEKRRWQKYHTIEIVRYLAQSIEQKVNLRNPDKIVRIDVLGNRTAVSLLKPGEMFSVTCPDTEPVSEPRIN